MVQEKINKIESRQLELLAKMKESDAYASKCAKLGLSFSAEYPQELAEYNSANEEYNSNEEELASLYEELAREQEKSVDVIPEE